MPSAYTAPVNDGTVTELRDYALLCARAFGALIDLRDDRLAPAPRQIPAMSIYHADRLSEANARLERLQTMTDDDKIVAAAAANAKLVQMRQEAVDKNTAILNRYNAMLAKVMEWEGPTELRQFMIEQLVESRKFDVSDNPTRFYAEPQEPDAWYADEIAEATKDVARHTKGLAEDTERHAERQAWLDRLWAALPDAETDK